MVRSRRAWSKTIEESGVHVRLFERAPGSMLYRELRHGDGKDRRSLLHRDRALAEQQARQLARHLAELRLTGGAEGLTFGHIVRLYLAHHAPVLSDRRRAQAMKKYAPLFLRHLGDAFLVDNLGQTQIDAFVAARRVGALTSPTHGGVRTAPRDGTIRNELNWLKSVARWARGYKVNGRRLLAAIPSTG